MLVSFVASTKAFAGQADGCDLASRKGPLSLLVLPTKSGVRNYAATVKDTPIVSHDATTVIFGDGRVVTSDVASASRQINELGWASRSIKVVASFEMRRQRRPGGFG